MAKNNYKYDYLRHVSDTAPDMNKLWDRIESEIDSRPNTKTAPQIQIRTNKNIKRFAACAASFIITAAGVGVYLSTQNNTDNKTDTNSSQIYFEEKTEETTPYIDPNRIISYSSLALESTTTVNYMKNFKGSGDEFFVEDNVLSQTEFFADVKVESAELSENMCTYTLKVISLVSKNGEQTDSDIEIKSSMPYILQENREYFIPLKKTGSEYEIVFENAPQIEITLDNDIVFPNTWESLDGNSCSVQTEKRSNDDFYYDRMRFSSKDDLQLLLTKWRNV